jgi:hypothetical protein
VKLNKGKRYFCLRKWCFLDHADEKTSGSPAAAKKKHATSNAPVCSIFLKKISRWHKCAATDLHNKNSNEKGKKKAFAEILCGRGYKRKRALRKAPSICYYPMKTLFVYKGISMLTLFEIFKPE